MSTSATGSFESDYFRDVYRKAYDGRNPRYKHRDYVRRVRAAQPKGGKLLDVGCAYGAFVREAQEHFSCVGCDISEHAVQVAAERYPGTEFFVSDVNRIDRAERFDVITCFDILEHVPELHSALGHLRGLLSADGVLVMTVPVYDTAVGQLVGMLDKDPTHVHKNSRYWWQETLAECGYELVDWHGILRYYFGHNLYLHWSNRLIRPFSPAILLVAKPAIPSAGGVPSSRARGKG